MNDELLDAELEPGVWFLPSFWFSSDLKEDMQSVPEWKKTHHPCHVVWAVIQGADSCYSCNLPVYHPTLQGYKPLREGLRKTCLISTEKVVPEDSMIAYVEVASGWVSQAALVPVAHAAGGYAAGERQTEAFSPTVISTPTNPAGP